MTDEERESVIRARWKTFYRGAWRPVTSLHRGKLDVTSPAVATSCVLYCDDDILKGEWVALEVGPGDVFRRVPPEAASELPWR